MRVIEYCVGKPHLPRFLVHSVHKEMDEGFRVVVLETLAIVSIEDF